MQQTLTRANSLPPFHFNTVNHSAFLSAQIGPPARAVFLPSTECKYVKLLSFDRFTVKKEYSEQIGAGTLISSYCTLGL